MGDTHSLALWLKDYLTSILWVSYFWKNIRTLFQRKRIKNWRSQSFPKCTKRWDRFKSCFLWSKVWQEGAAVSVPLSPSLTLWTENQRVTRGLTKYFWWGLQSPGLVKLVQRLPQKLRLFKLFIWTGTPKPDLNFLLWKTCCRFLFSKVERKAMMICLH